MPKFGAQPAENLQGDFLFRLLRAAGNEDEIVRLDGQKAAQLLRLGIGAIGAGAVVLDRAGDVNALRRGPE